MNTHTARAEADAQDPAITHETDRWVVPSTVEGATWWYLDNDDSPFAVPAEKPTDADRRRKALDSKLLKGDAWFQSNCYDCGMRLSRPIHGHCFE